MPCIFEKGRLDRFLFGVVLLPSVHDAVLGLSAKLQEDILLHFPPFISKPVKIVLAVDVNNEMFDCVSIKSLSGSC